MKVIVLIYWTLALGISKIIEETTAELNVQDLVQRCKETGNCKFELDGYNQQKIDDNEINPSEEELFGTVANQYQKQVKRYANLDDDDAQPEEYYKLKPQYLFGGRGRLRSRLFGANGGMKTKTAKPQEESTQYASLENYESNNANKRGSAFNSWGGKRIPQLRKHQLSSSYAMIEDPMINFKREPASFSSWGGKRTSKFYSWGGKRSIPQQDDQQEDYQLGLVGGQHQFIVDNTDNHKIMRRNIADTEIPATDDNNVYQLQDKLKRFDRKKLCSKLEGNVNLAELFREFLKWSKKRPEQKKGSYYRNGMKISALRTLDKPNRKGSEFFSWGGKRNFHND